MTRRAHIVIIAVLAVLSAVPTSAYLKFGYSIAGRAVVLKWPDGRPVSYFVGSRGGGGVSAGEFRDAVARAFGNWEALPTSAVRFTNTGVSDRPPSDNDGVT